MNTKLLIQGLALTTMLASANLASAVTYNLCTGVTTKTMPDSTIVTMWGYGVDRYYMQISRLWVSECSGSTD